MRAKPCPEKSKTVLVNGKLNNTELINKEVCKDLE